MNDETHYHINGQVVNKQNFRYWPVESSGVALFIVQKFLFGAEQHRLEVISRSILKMKMVYPNNTLMCCETLQANFATKVQISIELQLTVLEHRKQLCIKCFPIVILLLGNINYPSHSPDLTACNFFGKKSEVESVFKPHKN